MTMWRSILLGALIGFIVWRYSPTLRWHLVVRYEVRGDAGQIAVSTMQFQDAPFSWPMSGTALTDSVDNQWMMTYHITRPYLTWHPGDIRP